MYLFVALALTVPLLNFIFGIVAGLAVLAQLLKTKNIFSIVTGLILASIWFVIAMSVFIGFGGIDKRSPFFTIVLLLIHFAYNLWFLKWVNSQVKKPFDKQMEKLVSECSYGKNFKKFYGNGPCISYELDNKSIAIIFDDGYLIRPFAFIREFNLVTTQDANGSFSNVRIEFNTNDINFPFFSISFNSIVEVKKFNAELSIIFNS